VANKILVARGTKARIEEVKSSLSTNELVYSTDTGELGVKKANGNIEYFMNATDINAKVDPNAMAYFNYAGSFYGDKYSLLASAWESSLEVDPLEISEDSSYSSQRGTAQYPNGEIEGVIIPQGVTTIGKYAFWNWTSNNKPLVIPDSVTSIGSCAFQIWTSNSQPLVIPNSVTSIGGSAFHNWTLVPYVEIQSLTPPSLASIYAFLGQNDAPIYVPDESVDDYKTATNWVDLADRIFPISDKVVVMGDILALETANMIKSITRSGSNLFTITYYDDTTSSLLTLAELKTFIGEATQSLSGLMSAQDKVDLDTLMTLFDEDGDSVVNTIAEILAIFENYPEGADLVTALAGKVDKVSGKGLSTNDFTNNDKNKLDGIEAGAEVNPYSKTQLDNMFDDKVDKVTGKGLSTNDFTTTEKNKLSGIQAGAQVNAVTTVAGRTGAVVLEKADVGLGSVQNYAIASKTQAEAGTSNVLYMTPLRTKEAITAAMGDIESALDAILGV